MSTLKITEKDREVAQNTELRSEEIQDILGQVPRRIIRYGTVLIFIIIALLLLASVSLKYPDVIVARIQLTTETPPAELKANIEGRIQSVLISDRQTVAKDQELIIIESAAIYPDIKALKAALGEEFHMDTLLHMTLPNTLKLGGLQESYASLTKLINDYKDFVSINYHSRKINSVEAEIRRYKFYLESLKSEEEVLEKEYNLVSRQFLRDSLLFAQEVLSSVQLEKSETEKLNKMRQWNETKTKLAAAQIEVSNLEQEILELELRLEESSRQYTQKMREAYDNLQGELALWEKKYLIKAPFKGQVTFTRIWSENQYVNQGEIVVTVIPEIQGNIIGITEFSPVGAGKVKEGNQVLIQFDNYPYMEFGTVSGEVSSLSLVPSDEVYRAEIKLDSTRLLTNYNLEIAFQQNMPGTAEIITDERNLLSRILAPFKSVIHKQKAMN